MLDYPADIYTEPEVDPDTLANLGPLAALAGVWESDQGSGQHPEADGTERAVFVERHELQPIDGQTNGPQLFYGLRYHQHVVEPGEVETFHDQVGYWLWEPATGTVLLTVSIPRGQVALAAGRCEPDATAFEVVAERGSTTNGIVSNPFLDTRFTTTHFRMTVTVNLDGSWTYEQNSKLVLPDRAQPFDHVERNTLHRVAPPTPNPTARAAGLGVPASMRPATAPTRTAATRTAPDGSLRIGSLRAPRPGPTAQEHPA